MVLFEMDFIKIILYISDSYKNIKIVDRERREKTYLVYNSFIYK